jgi:hypothetical protein
VLAVNIAKTLASQYQKLKYSGIDLDPKFVTQTQEALGDTDIENPYIIAGDCFAKDIDKLPNNAGLVVASNIAYYAKNINLFVDNLLRKTSEDGIAVFLHESALADPNVLRAKYKSPVETSTVDSIAKALRYRKVSHTTIQLTSVISFPENITELWDELAICSEYSAFKNLQNYQEAKALLEFIVQVPLESLKAQEKLGEYLKDIQALMNKQNGKLILRTDIQIATSKEKDKDINFSVLLQTAKEVEAEFRPKPTIHPIEVLQFPELRTALAKGGAIWAKL